MNSAQAEMLALAARQPSEHFDIYMCIQSKRFILETAHKSMVENQWYESMV